MNDFVKFLHNRIDDRKIPFILNNEWREYISKHDKDTTRQELAEYIIENSITFPTKIITYEQFAKLFLKFAKTSMLSLYKDVTNVVEKFDYKYKYSDKALGVIDKSHAYNSVSNYFQQENRMKCGSNMVDSPWEIWHNYDKLCKMNWHFWRLGALGKDAVCAKTFRSAFRIGTYTATQFKPSVAKALYEKYNAKKILDTSCGWGDRLAGFYATPNTELYIGCDPNPEVYETYKDQCLEYENLLGCDSAVLQEFDNHFICIGTKKVVIYNLPCEDIDWSQYKNYFDFYFTSPPYFETERYAKNNSETQSYSRYPTFEKWKHEFFFHVNKMIYETIANNGHMMINIIEPGNEKNQRYNLCDDMVDHISSFPDAHYMGKIGMRLQARPHKIIETNSNTIFVEPIWVFKKQKLI